MAYAALGLFVVLMLVIGAWRAPDSAGPHWRQRQPARLAPSRR